MFNYLDKSQRRHPLGIIRSVSQCNQDYKTKDPQQSGKIQTTHSSFCCYSRLIFPSPHFQTDSIEYRHSLHMRCHNTPRNTRGNHFHTFSIMRSYHASVCVWSPGGGEGSQGLVAQLSWCDLQLAGRVSLTGKTSVMFFVSFVSETGQGRSPPSLFPSLCSALFTSPTWQISAPPLQLPFSAVDTRTHSSIAVGVRQHRAPTVQALPPWI